MITLVGLPLERILTGNENQTGSDHIFPQRLMIAGLESLGHIIVPCNIDGHIAGQPMGYVNCKGQHTLNELGQSKGGEGEGKKLISCLSCRLVNLTYNSLGRFNVIDPMTLGP